MPTFGGRRNSSLGASVGVIGAAEVSAPMSTGSAGTSLVSADSAATWAVGLFVAAIILLFFVL